MGHPTEFAELVRSASQRVLATADSLDGEAWTRPSLLPGWSAGHVVSHLTLNAEGLARAVDGVVSGDAVPMYRSEEDRDADIATLARSGTAVLHVRLRSAVNHLARAWEQVTPEVAGRSFERIPGGRSIPVGAVAWLRLRELEIHHCDLGPDVARYSPAMWPVEFTTQLLERDAAQRTGTGFVARATDLDRTWTFGTPGPTVTGDSYTLAWWLTGRPPYPGTEGPVSTDGDLPRIEGA